MMQSQSMMPMFEKLTQQALLAKERENQRRRSDIRIEGW